MCTVARDAGLNVHYSTNLSFVLSDQRIRRIVASGVSHLTVCVDGLSQKTYGLTRVGGRIDLVLSNLQRLCRYRAEMGQRRPQIEVQYIKYQHNLAELEEARRLFTSIGVDQVYELWGGLHNYTDRDPGNYTVFGPRKSRLLPRCHWPFFFLQIKYNGDVLPCCCHRLGQQYARMDDPRCAGNVFDTSVRQVWNSTEYHRARRLVSRPRSIDSDATLSGHFCAACPRVFHTDYATATCRWGEDYSFEDLYTVDPRGRPVRRRDTRPQAMPVQAPGGSEATPTAAP
jgi:MoaA/NifB/PqqE/SkfB family radical SAM enzyme